MSKNVSVEVLVATMHQFSLKKYEEMNLQTDAVFANQADEYSYMTSNIDNHRVRMITTATRGVGKNRNIALMHADGDIAILADDDMQFTNGYESAVIDAFKKVKKADVIIFNITTEGYDHGRRTNERIKRIHYHNAFNYGAARIAIKINSLKREGILFNENFGGGTIYSAGEDSLFIKELLSRGLKVYAYPYTIAVVNQANSTWFRGYNDKYFFDKGALFKAISRHLYWLLLLQDVIRHRKMYAVSHMSLRQILIVEFEGARNYTNLNPFNASNRLKTK